MKQALASAYSNRLESKMRRTYSVVLTLSFVEVVFNYRLQAGFLSPLFDLFFALISIAVILVLLTAWIRRFNDFALWFHAGATAVAVVALPILESTESAASWDFGNPWVWWCVGPGAMSAAVSGKRIAMYIFLPALAFGWLQVHLILGWSANPLFVGLQDSLYALLLAGTVAGLIALLREWGNGVDRATTLLYESRLNKAKADAVEREQQRIDALVHDSVLHTLVFAASAKSTSERESAVKLADIAMEKLDQAWRPQDHDGSVTPLGLLRAIKKLALDQNDDIQVNLRDGGNEPLPAAVGDAITEATLQALENALQHSGAKNFLLTLSSPQDGVVEVEFSDDGKGFNKNRVPRDRIGIQLSILGRMQSAGGSATISTSPGKGTTVKLRWPK